MNEIIEAGGCAPPIVATAANDKPVCYQCQVLLGRGMEGPWLSYDTAAERDARVAEHLREGRACYMRELYDRPQPAAPQVPRRMSDRDKFESSPYGDGYADGWNACIDSMLATPPAPEHPKAECPCGEATCEEPWEPGCGLGRSEEHVRVAEQPKAAPCAMRPYCCCVGACLHSGNVRSGCDDDREGAETAYIRAAFDYERHPIGSREWALFFAGWKARGEQPKPAGDVEALAEWLEREMPAGTVIGDPRWWAERIVRRLSAQPAQVKCWCLTCRPQTPSDMRFVLCPTCGNKRCPHANDHRNACTGSNEVGQPGSSWEHVKPAQGEGEK